MYFGKVEICGVNTAKLKNLTDEEKRELLKRSKSGDSMARSELIDGNLRLVLSIIQRFINRKENMDDLFQVGCIGLIKAIDNFNIELDVKFSTYAVPMIIEWREKHWRLIMTRKQALLKAIEILTIKGNEEKSVQLLKDIYEELPLIHWSDKSIRDAINQFIVDNNRIPTVTDFKKKGMPSHPVIKNKYGITLSEWLSINYPTQKLSFEEKKEIYTREFIELYHKIKPKNQKEFESNKNKNSVGWKTIASYYNVKSWRSLLTILNLPLYLQSYERRNSPKITVKIFSDYDFNA